MNITLNRPVMGIFSALLLSGCGSTKLVSTPIENIDTVVAKTTELTEPEKERWPHMDLLTDTVPGMSLDKAYTEIIPKLQGEKVIVAVLDSGIDLEHEDLKNVLWTNAGEIPNNNTDDDNNGYVDDVHGYNFLGDSYNEQLEYVRMLRLNIGSEEELTAAKKLQEEKYQEALQGKEQFERTLQIVKQAHGIIQKELGKDSYTLEDLSGIQSTDPMVTQSAAVAQQMFALGSMEDAIAGITDAVDYYAEQLNYNLKLDFDGRAVVGDKPYDITDTSYGDGNPQSRTDDEKHGTHVAGIIAAQRGNGIGLDGTANLVEIMSIRAVPNGDEYDKDIALGIRYAVDNGAKIINCSFGKSFSPKREWVYDALKYAASKDVLIVHAAGNDGLDLDNPVNANFPNDQIDNGPEMVKNMITVGALTEQYGDGLVSSFSNYGSINVDVFAPGSGIYSTVPPSKYEFLDGTSMAAPAVAGVAALIRSYFPKLSAAQVKQILMQSGLSSKASVVVAGDDTQRAPFTELSTSGKIVNAYNALIMADQVAAGKLKL